ncbi:cytochrome c biogenesis protein CcsA [Paenibacillus macquariensis]|uniref:Cytochrome c-type biogenesis protein CcsB n=1 Tax=Paenibacillus macquariensis TaxID=948756 RepID=A0ABY1JJX9_9BACL|nr:cytochrome c biogenesis protein CcsA [Paenibacillus macquariensis]MEC0089803.1 cytochrome c biogenesis protein CcsA [Paenibacillus macquariensis]OAB30728.1 c-type cytochrome biogenesis protein CcsB [Paenibacillus macquariensis subsp. macquariensis]SIQ31523.1 cytochrome c-type biogenesis protein CcsB [Paenibacillus macquariensis]
MNLLDFSSLFFTIAFLVYGVAFILYGVAVMGSVWRNRDPKLHMKKWGKISFSVSSLGLASHLIYFFTRWAGAGHIPVSNMFEFMSTLSMMIMIAFTVIFIIYRKTLLGLFSVPIAIIIMAYAAVFPQEAQPLIPSLQSWWLQVHVTMAALGESFFAIGFAAGFMYLLRTVDFNSKNKSDRRQQRGVEFTLLSIVIVIGFIASVYAFRVGGYETVFTQEQAVNAQGDKTIAKVEYNLPPIVAPYQSEVESFQSFLGIDKPLFEAPSWMVGINAGRKLNTIIWSVLAGLILYALIRLILRKPLGKAIHPLLKGLDADDLDEITYRTIAIGFPIFTLGALIFAMMWAQIAWGRFWGWDPKEVWALITWLFYSVYLHLRLSRGWQGKKSAWLAVLGFMIVMFTLVGVNLVIAGLHSYAGTN